MRTREAAGKLQRSAGKLGRALIFMNSIRAEIGEPIIFRTCAKPVYDAALSTGSIWLRSDHYYRNIEDQARLDRGEGVNSAKLGIVLTFQTPERQILKIAGRGTIGQQIISHYIMSLHASSISAEQIAAFGGHTFGVKAFSRLIKDVFTASSAILPCKDARAGPVIYQYATLGLHHNVVGSAALSLGGTPPVLLNPIDTDVLRKEPVSPFIDQDEWRIVLFVDQYINDDPNEILRINVDPSHFYPYSTVA